MAKNRFTTYDLNLASFLVFSGIFPTLEKNNSGKVIFYFPTTPDLYSVIEQFNDDETLVKLSSFISCQKALRGQMLKKRDGG